MPSSSKAANRQRFKLLAASVTLILTTSGLATAQNIVVSISGTLTLGSQDTAGLFGPKGGDLSNKNFTTMIDYISTAFSLSDPLCSTFTYSSNAAASMVISTIINNISFDTTSSISPPSCFDAYITFDQEGSTTTDGFGSLTSRQNSQLIYNTAGLPTIYNMLSPMANTYVTLALTNKAEAEDLLTGIVGFSSVTSENYKDAGAPSCSCGDPIDIGSGNVYEAVTDYTTVSPNQLAFTRSYNGLGNPVTLAAVLGAHWRTNYDRYLRITDSNGTPTSVVVERPDGQELEFTLTGGAWTTDTDVDATLSEAGSAWTYTDRSDTVETYAQTSPIEAIVTSIRARGGYTQTLTYNGSNQLATVTDSYGRRLAFDYEGTLLQTVVTPDNGTLTFGYTPVTVNGAASNALTSVKYPTSPATSVRYIYGNSSFPAALTGMLDEDGNAYASWTYDAGGRGLSSQHAGGADLTTIAHNDIDGSRTVTNALGDQSLYKFTTLQGVPKVMEIDRLASATTAAASEFFSYDVNGYLTSSTDWTGAVTTYINDVRGLPKKITEAVGTKVARLTSTIWDRSLHVPTQVATTGLNTDFTYDSLGNLVTRNDRAAGVSRSWSYSWTPKGQLISVVGPRTDLTQTTSFTYDKDGALASLTDALGHVTQITASTSGGLPLTIVDPNGVSTQYSYDGRQRPLSRAIVTASGTLTTRYTYDLAGDLTRTRLPDGSYLANSYDAAHRLTATTDAIGDMVAYTLDSLGDRTATLTGKSGGSATWQDNEAFDQLGRVSTDRRGAGQTTAFTYDADGRLLTTTDPLLRVTKRTVDALGRVTRIANPAGGKTTLSYDAHDRITQITAPNSATTQYFYDGLGRLVQRASPDTGITGYMYDLADNLTQSTDAAGVVTDRNYDALNRLIATIYPAKAAQNAVFTYDEPGHGFGIGRLTDVVDPAAKTSFAYDERGNELSETRAGGRATLMTSYRYDAASRVESIVYPSGMVATYAHDKAGQVVSVEAQKVGATGVSSIVDGVSYMPFGPLTTLTYGNGLAESRLYDPSYRLSTLTTGGVQGLGYTYDAADNVKAITDSVVPGNSQTFDYDALNRLTMAAGVYGSFAWTYDPAGNRRTEQPGGGTESKYSYLPSSNVLTSISTGGQTTDITTSPAGNVLTLQSGAGGTTSLTYNQAERLKTVSVGTTQVASYIYDAFGQRYSKTASSGNSLFQYDQEGHLLEETSSSGLLKTDTIYLNGVPVADLTKNVIYFMHTDRLGTPQVATNSAQAIAWSTDYQPFGQDTNTLGVFTQNLRFPGQYADAGTGLYQNEFRDYDPSWGRYVESDPIGLAGGVNTYGYVGGNPLEATDRFGLQAEDFEPGQPYTQDMFSGRLYNFTQQTNQNYRNLVQVPNYLYEVTELAHDLNEIQKAVYEYNVTHLTNQNANEDDPVIQQLFSNQAGSCPSTGGTVSRDTVLSTPVSVPLISYPANQQYLANPY